MSVVSAKTLFPNKVTFTGSGRPIFFFHGRLNPLQGVGVVVAVWKRISRHRAFHQGVSLLRTKSRDNVGAVSTAG